MGTLPFITEPQPAQWEAKPTLFAQVLVTLTKEEHIQLILDAKYWKSAHQRALVRALERELAYQRAMERAVQREAELRIELETAQAKIRDLQKRVFGRKSERTASTEKAGRPDGLVLRPSLYKA